MRRIKRWRSRRRSAAMARASASPVRRLRRRPQPGAVPLGGVQVVSRPVAEVVVEGPTVSDNRAVVLQFVQPALAGMMDGSVSTLAPLFATALATRDAHTTFLVGLAAAVGAGISMAF